MGQDKDRVVTIHLVVHDHPGFGYHDARAEEEIDGCSQGQGQAGGVGGHYVRCAMTSFSVIVRGFRPRPATKMTHESWLSNPSGS